MLDCLSSRRTQLCQWQTMEAQREYMRNWRARRRAEWFTDKKCAICGSTEKLELDHVDPTNKVHHQIWTWSKERRDAELAKCQVLCSVCHLEKTKTDLRQMDFNSRWQIADPPGMAWCNAGKHFAPVGVFTKNHSKRRGLENECRSCRKQRRTGGRKPPVREVAELQNAVVA